LYKTQKVKIYMYQYFKRQLKTPTCFGSFGIHPQRVLKVLHWNYLWCFMCVFGVWQREIWTCGVCVPGTHTPQVQILNAVYLVLVKRITINA